MRKHWWQFWRRQPWWLPTEDYEDELPYGASANRLGSDWWEYGRRSGWW